MQLHADHRYLVAGAQGRGRGGKALAAARAQVVYAQVDGAEFGQLAHALGSWQMLVIGEGADQCHGAATHVEQGGNDPAVQDAVDEVADQFGFHRQVHGHPLGAQLIELDTEHLIEGDALEEARHGLLQVVAEDEGLGHGRGSGEFCCHAAAARTA